MTNDESTSLTWISELVAGNDEVVAEFWSMYGSGLQKLAGRAMTPQLRGRMEPEDVVQSACRSFFRRTQSQDFGLRDREGLWRLLCAITLTKVKQHTRFHYRKRRSVAREVSDDDQAANADSRRANPVQPTPEEVVVFAESMASLLGSLSTEEQSIVQLKLEGHQNAEIAAKLNRSERTVGRLLQKIRQQWAEGVGQHAL